VGFAHFGSMVTNMYRVYRLSDLFTIDFHSSAGFIVVIIEQGRHNAVIRASDWAAY
jgi:hypothetical protein